VGPDILSCIYGHSLLRQRTHSEKIEAIYSILLALQNPIILSFQMEPSSKRSKKSDKAKEKAGRPSSKHARLYEAMVESKKESGKDSMPKKDKKN